MIPDISGTAGGQSVSEGSNINPFTNVSVTDGNDYIHDTTLTISLLDSAGNPTDNNGKLTLSGDDGGTTSFSETSSGVYTLVDHSTPSPARNLQHFQDALPKLTFIPSGAGTTRFSLVTSDSDNEHQSDSTTTVNAQGSGSASQSASVSSSDQTVTVNNGNHVTIDNPSDFQGTLNLVNGYADLPGLVSADSITWQNDMLSIYDGNGKIIDITHETGGSNFSVEKTQSGVTFFTNNDTQHPDGSVLPWH